MSVFDSYSSPQSSGVFESETNLSLDVKQANFAFLSSMERGSLALPPSRMEENAHDGAEVDNEGSEVDFRIFKAID